MFPFECVQAADFADALALLAQHGACARVLAGGTDLLVELKSAREGPRILIDISRVPGLDRIALGEDGLHIGAGATHTAISRSTVVRSACAALAEAVQAIGAVQTRNAGTIGGNLATAVPSMDSGPALLALDAQLVLASERGERRLPLQEFFVGPRKTALKADELLAEIVIPKASLGKPMAFVKFGLRRGQALALVNVAAGFFSEGSPVSFSAPRIALGAVAPTVIRATHAEAALAGHPVESASIAEAARIAAAESKPITDFRASAGYRRALVEVLVRRALTEAWVRSMRATAREAA